MFAFDVFQSANCFYRTRVGVDVCLPNFSLYTSMIPFRNTPEYDNFENDTQTQLNEVSVTSFDKDQSEIQQNSPPLVCGSRFRCCARFTSRNVAIFLAMFNFGYHCWTITNTVRIHNSYGDWIMQNSPHYKKVHYIIYGIILLPTEAILTLVGIYGLFRNSWKCVLPLLVWEGFY